ncbi:MAG: acyl carrier protein [Clostridia bacterium]|nr:acyl carrier protein [Clostridia bacterium]
MDISEKLKQIVAAQLKIEADSIEDSTDIVDDLGADSLDIVEILMVIEEQFGVTIPDEDITGLRNLADMQAYIENNM